MAMARVLLFGLFLFLSLHTQCMATRAIRQDDKGRGVGVDDNLNVNDDDINPFISPSSSSPSPFVDDSLLTDSPPTFDDNNTSPAVSSPPAFDDSLLTDSPSALVPVPVPSSFIDDSALSPPTYFELSPSPQPQSPPLVNAGSSSTFTKAFAILISIVLFLFM